MSAGGVGSTGAGAGATPYSSIDPVEGKRDKSDKGDVESLSDAKRSIPPSDGNVVDGEKMSERSFEHKKDVDPQMTKLEETARDEGPEQSMAAGEKPPVLSDKEEVAASDKPAPESAEAEEKQDAVKPDKSDSEVVQAGGPSQEEVSSEGEKTTPESSGTEGEKSAQGDTEEASPEGGEQQTT